MEIAIKKWPRVVLAEEGVPLCEISISLPEVTSEGKAEKRCQDFYTALKERTLSLAREVILPHARRAYLESTDPRRRFTQRPYRLTLSCTPRPAGEAFTVTRSLHLLHRGRSLYTWVEHDRITHEGRVLPDKGNRIKRKRKKNEMKSR